MLLLPSRSRHSFEMSIYMKRATQRLPLQTELQLSSSSTSIRHQYEITTTQLIVCFVNAFIFVGDVLVSVCVLIAAQETTVLFSFYSVTAEFVLLIQTIGSFT